VIQQCRRLVSDLSHRFIRVSPRVL